MSDPMTNVEIEDVLSSIRRLVAQDPPPRPAPPSRLILTPALRVDEAAASVAVVQAAVGAALDAAISEAAMAALAQTTTPLEGAQDVTATVAPEPFAGEKAIFGATVEPPGTVDRAVAEAAAEETVAEPVVAETPIAEAAIDEEPLASEPVAETLEAAEPLQGAEAVSVSMEDAPADTDTEVTAEDAVEAAAGLETVADGAEGQVAPAEEIPPAPFHHVDDEEVAATEEAEAVLTVPTPFLRHRDRKSLEDTVAELEAAVSRQPFDWEPDGLDLGHSTSADPATTEFGHPEPEPQEATLAEDVAAILSEPVSPTEDDDAVAESLEADLLAEFSALSDKGMAADPVEDAAQSDRAPIVFLSASRRLRPDGPGPRAGSDEIGEATDLAKVQRATMMPAAEAGQFLPALPFDEEDLRELVAKVLREELRGELGERITRNVRKLVRREIAQIISGLEVD